MFCSKCGKTIRSADQICPSCGAQIGDNRFGGIPYTSAQFTIAPGQELPNLDNYEPANDYTRTSYTSMDDAAVTGGDADSRTTYRPVYEATEDVRRGMRAAMNPEPEEEQPEAQEPEQPARSQEELSPAAKATIIELGDDLQPEEAVDLSQFVSRPIRSAGRAGISRDVSEYIRRLEDDQTRKGARHRRAAAPVYDDYQERSEEEYPEDYGEAYADENGYEDGYGRPDDGEGAFEDMDEADFDDMRRPYRFSPSHIIKIVLALIVVAALIVGGILWIRHISGSKSSTPIEGVSESLYTQGIELIKTRATSEYTDELLNMFRQSESILPVYTRLEQDKAAISALLPEEPALNDATFISALQAIHDNISSAITTDAMALGSADSGDIARSEANWQIVNNSITQLEQVKEAAELTAIIGGQKITVQAATPQPTATPVVYTTLQKGDKNDSVLKLQERLYRLGYLNDDRDGAFGGKTQTALKAFQERAGIEASGIADPATQTLLFSDQAPYAEGVASPTPSVQATPEPQIIEPVNDVQANPVSGGN